MNDVQDDDKIEIRFYLQRFVEKDQLRRSVSSKVLEDEHDYFSTSTDLVLCDIFRHISDLYTKLFLAYMTNVVPEDSFSFNLKFSTVYESRGILKWNDDDDHWYISRARESISLDHPDSSGESLELWSKYMNDNAISITWVNSKSLIIKTMTSKRWQIMIIKLHAQSFHCTCHVFRREWHMILSSSWSSLGLIFSNI